MRGLKMLIVVLVAMALASCGEFPTEPASGFGTRSPNSVATQTVREVGFTGITEFHVRVTGSTTAEFYWTMSGRCSGFYLRRVGMNYVAIYPPPYDIPDPTATSKVERAFAPNSPVGIWELIPYTDAQGARSLGTPARLHPKEAATRTFPA